MASSEPRATVPLGVTYRDGMVHGKLFTAASANGLKMAFLIIFSAS